MEKNSQKTNAVSASHTHFYFLFTNSHTCKLLSNTIIPNVRMCHVSYTKNYVRSRTLLHSSKYDSWTDVLCAAQSFTINLQRNILFSTNYDNLH